MLYYFDFNASHAICLHLMKLLNLFRRPDYQSETTLFIDALKQAKPSLESEQLAGRALLWEQAVSREAQADNQSSRVAQKSYVYSAA
jgi:Protein of unknown function (DUF3460)